MMPLDALIAQTQTMFLEIYTPTATLYLHPGLLEEYGISLEEFKRRIGTGRISLSSFVPLDSIYCITKPLSESWKESW